MNAPVPPPTEASEVEADGTEKPPRKRLTLYIVGGVVAAAGAIYALTHLGHAPTERAPIDQMQAVTIARVAERTFTPKVSLSGEARPVRDIHVVAPTSGVRILEILADEGDTVRAGQPLARLDTAVSNAQTRSAQAAVAQANSAAVRARGEYERAESIRDSGALSTEAIAQRKAAADAADAQLAAARAQLAEVNARLQGGYVRAPVAGLVIDRQAMLGAPVDGQTLFRIAGNNELEVAAQVSEADILALSDGQTATFKLVDGTNVVGRLRRTAASIDTRTRTGEALFTLPRDTRARAGMYLRGEAALAPRQAIAIPQSAVLFRDGAAYVFVIDAEDRAQRTPITVGLREGGLVEVTGGLTAGQRVAGAGAAFLQHGDKVRPVEPGAQTTQQAQLRGRKE
ncbi:MAG: efflux RND transporter periplasmic adaptor subunit [Hyphomonadaceae bacterium]|nr:efflux RND transporter periplasmic adaptor subunit [Hyphomonadaceae bacterium]